MTPTEAQQRRVPIMGVQQHETFSIRHKRTKVVTVVDDAAWAALKGKHALYERLDEEGEAVDDTGDADEASATAGTDEEEKSSKKASKKNKKTDSAAE